MRNETATPISSNPSNPSNPRKPCWQAAYCGEARRWNWNKIGLWANVNRFEGSTNQSTWRNLVEQEAHSSHSVGKNLNIILCDSNLNNFEHLFGLISYLLQNLLMCFQPLFQYLISGGSVFRSGVAFVLPQHRFESQQSKSLLSVLLSVIDIVLFYHLNLTLIRLISSVIICKNIPDTMVGNTSFLIKKHI